MLQEQRHPISGMAKAGRSPQQAVEAGLERWPGHSLTWVSLGEPNEGPSYAAGMTNASVVSPTAIRIRPSQRSAGRGNGGGWGEGIHADLRNDTDVIVRDYPGSDLLPDLAQARKKINHSWSCQITPRILRKNQKLRQCCRESKDKWPLPWSPGKFYEREDVVGYRKQWIYTLGDERVWQRCLKA